MNSVDPPHAPFVEQLERHRGIIVSVLNAYCARSPDRDDVAQIIAAELWRSYPRYDGRVRFSTWMYRIAVNVAISHYRREHRDERALAVYDSEMLATVATASSEADLARSALDDLIETLDALDRALVLLYLDENSYADIATVLGISETNVATKLSRIRARFRSDLATHSPLSMEYKQWNSMI